MTRPSTSNQQDDQHDQQHGAEAAPDIRTPVVVAATTEQKHENNNQDNQVHDVPPPGNHFEVDATAGAPATLPLAVASFALRTLSAETFAFTTRLAAPA